MACNHQTRGQGFLLGTFLSHRSVMGGAALLEDTQPLGLDIRKGASLPGYLCRRVLHRVYCFLPAYVYLIFGSIMVYVHVSLVGPSF
jgi:hypothetical protein